MKWRQRALKQILKFPATKKQKFLLKGNGNALLAVTSRRYPWMLFKERNLFHSQNLTEFLEKFAELE